jgi:hypothetical protein
MHSRKHSLAGRVTLRRLVRRSVARAVETAGEGELVETLAWELGRSLRAEGTGLRGNLRGGILTEVRLASEEARARVLVELGSARSENAQDELELQRAILDDAHDAMIRRASADGPVLDGELVRGIGELFDRARDGELTFEALREATLAHVRRSSDAGRDGMLEAWAGERDRRMDVLRRRLAKVNQLLADSEEALGRLGQRDDGIRSLYRTVQGLDELTPDAARKRLLLAEIYRANIALRSHRDSA